MPVEAWIAPRAAEIAGRLREVPAVREVCELAAAEAVFRDERHAGRRWPLLFFAVWSLIHLEGASLDEALPILVPSA